MNPTRPRPPFFAQKRNNPIIHVTNPCWSRLSAALLFEQKVSQEKDEISMKIRKLDIRKQYYFFHIKEADFHSFC